MKGRGSRPRASGWRLTCCAAIGWSSCSWPRPCRCPGTRSTRRPSTSSTPSPSGSSIGSTSSSADRPSTPTATRSPGADGSLTEPGGQPLASLDRGQRFRLVRVVDQDPSFLRYLTECGLDLGTEGTLEENRPEAGAVTLRVGERSVALGTAAAGKVLVTSPTVAKGS